jgi:hypothetical protein
VEVEDTETLDTSYDIEEDTPDTVSSEVDRHRAMMEELLERRRSSIEDPLRTYD